MRVDSILTQKSCGCAAFRHGSAVQDYNFIRPRDCAHTMGDHKNGSVFNEAGESCLYQRLILDIEGRGGLMFIYTNPRKPHKH